jgi:hypothetical protein
MANLLALTTFDIGFELRPLCSAGITRPPRSYGPVCHPPRPGPIVIEPPLIPTLGITAMGFPCCADSPCANTPSPLPRRNLWVPVSLTFPEMAAFPVSRPAQLLSVHSRYGLHARRVPKEPSTREASDASLPPRLLSLLPAGVTVAGWEFHPLKNRAFARRTEESGLKNSGRSLHIHPQKSI